MVLGKLEELVKDDESVLELSVFEVDLEDEEVPLAEVADVVVELDELGF